jgi:hypothetical protein
MPKVHRLRVILGLKKMNFPELLGQAKAIYKGLSGHPSIFVTPNPPLAVLDTKINALDDAQQETSTLTKGMTALRNLKAEELITSLETARAYVQELVDANPEQGEAIITAAAMKAAAMPVYEKPILDASQIQPGAPVRLAGNVRLLTAGIPGKVFFNWQMRPSGGSTWVDRPSTPNGQTEIAGLSPLTTHEFRVSITSSKGTGVWSQAVTLLVR